MTAESVMSPERAEVELAVITAAKKIERCSQYGYPTAAMHAEFLAARDRQTAARRAEYLAVVS